MPESRCNECGKSVWKLTIEELKTWELSHHKSSATIFKNGDKLHSCRGFLELNDNGRPKVLRIYNYDILVETIDAS